MKGIKITSLLLMVIMLLALVTSVGFAATLAPTPTPSPTATITPTPVYGHWQNEYLHNGTGQVANDVEKWLEGNVLISKWYSNKFTSFSYMYISSSNVTKLRWYNGTVYPCQTTFACFRTNKYKIKHRYLPRWSFNGVPGLVAGAALSADFTVNTGGANMIISNDPLDGGPVTIGTLQIRPTNIIYDLNALTWDNLESPNWTVNLSNIHLDLNKSMTLPTVPIGAGIVYRAKIWLDADPNNVVIYTGQFVPEPIGIPTPTLTPPATPSPTPVPSPKIYYSLQNEYLHNGTGQTANDLEKFIDGKIIAKPYSTTFPGFYYQYDPTYNYTILRWYGKNIAPCQTIGACFYHNAPQIKHRYLPRWSFNGVPEVNAGAALSASLNLTNPLEPVMTISNTAADGGPVTLGIIQIGASNDYYPLEALYWDNLHNIPWQVTINDIHLALNQNMVLPSMQIPFPGASVLYRATIWLDSDPSNVVTYVGEFAPVPAPTVTPTSQPTPTILPSPVI